MTDILPVHLRGAARRGIWLAGCVALLLTSGGASAQGKPPDPVAVTPAARVKTKKAATPVVKTEKTTTPPVKTEKDTTPPTEPGKPATADGSASPTTAQAAAAPAPSPAPVPSAVTAPAAAPPLCPAGNCQELPVPAPSEPAPHSNPTEPYPPVDPPPAIVIGKGYHSFDHPYLLFGLNSQYPSRFSFPFYDVIEELEVSAIPPLTDNLFWVGAWASLGMRYRGRDDQISSGAKDNHTKTGLRGGFGVEGGWRFLGADVGYIRDQSRAAGDEYEQLHRDTSLSSKDYKDALRFRVGMTLAAELFTHAHFSRSCCIPKESTTVCECERNPVGGSLFIYWAHENYYRDGSFLRSQSEWQGMFGFSLKVAVGL